MFKAAKYIDHAKYLLKFPRTEQLRPSTAIQIHNPVLAVQSIVSLVYSVIHLRFGNVQNDNDNDDFKDNG